MDTIDFSRYIRQINFSKIGESGQKLIWQSRALIVGCGAVGSAVANCLVRGGIGFIRIIDDDRVEMDNLQRQSLYTEVDVNSQTLKVDAAKEYLDKVNSMVKIEAIAERVTDDNIMHYLGDIDIIFDGTDNLSTRFIINRAAVTKKIAYVYGAAAGDTGSVMLITPKGPCLRCLIKDETARGETAQTAGILNQITSIVGSIETTLGFRYILNDYDDCFGILYTVNCWNVSTESFIIDKDPTCPVCRKQ